MSLLLSLIFSLHFCAPCSSAAPSEASTSAPPVDKGTGQFWHWIEQDSRRRWHKDPENSWRRELACKRDEGRENINRGVGIRKVKGRIFRAAKAVRWIKWIWLYIFLYNLRRVCSRWEKGIQVFFDFFLQVYCGKEAQKKQGEWIRY